MDLLPWARDLAEELLAERLPRRWAHSQGVGQLAEVIGDLVGDEGELLAAAAWLHDIGYVPELAKTGMHQLDGARYLRDVAAADSRVCSLVAHHTCAGIEAGLRGLRGELESEFPPVGGLPADVLTYCDISTTPDGELTNVKERLAEIFDRYAPGSIVFESMTEATPSILDSVARVSSLLARGS